VKKRKYKYLMYFLAKNNKEISTAATRRSSRIKSIVKSDIDDDSDDDDITSTITSTKHGI